MEDFIITIIPVILQDFVEVSTGNNKYIETLRQIPQIGHTIEINYNFVPSCLVKLPIISNNALK